MNHPDDKDPHKPHDSHGHAPHGHPHGNPQSGEGHKAHEGHSHAHRDEPHARKHDSHAAHASRRGHHEPSKHKDGEKRGGDHQPHEKPPPIAKGGTVALIGIIAVILFAVAFVIGFWVHHERLKKREELAKEVRDQPPVVTLAKPTPSEKDFNLALPADVRAWASTALYARTNGYLASWTFDIGDKVRKGDVLAVISAPDTDADLEQARAALNQATTNHQLAVATDERYKGLIPTQGVTQEQLDQTKSSRDQALANVKSSAANVDRMKALVGFEKIVAPFDGVVTSRTYDNGALISATNTQADQALFTVENDDKLRVFANVPQAYTELIHNGDTAYLTLDRNFPGHRFTGRVSRSASTLDPATRTLHTEIDFDNGDPKRRIYPGMFGQAIFVIKRSQPVLLIPTSALLVEAEGNEVAVVGQDNKVKLTKVVLGSDFGQQIEVLSGLTQDDPIVVNPGERLGNGIVVKPAPPEGSKDTQNTQGGGDAQPGDQKQGDPKQADKKQEN